MRGQRLPSAELQHLPGSSATGGMCRKVSQSGYAR
jgi:hypothetical protein